MTNYSSLSEFIKAKEDTIGEIVRDMCAVGVPSMPKSAAREKVVNLIRQAAKAGREAKEKEIIKILNDWTAFTCHTRKHHARYNNDCPGWSHEDQETRALVIKQILFIIAESEKQTKEWMEK